MDEETGKAGDKRFGVMLFPDRPISVLIDRIAWLERLDRRGLWFDSWSVLAAAVGEASRIGLGVLVANQILRPPAQLAKQAITPDHLSGGRFELGLGAGIFDWDHHSVGEQPWSPRERMQRFTDYVAIVDGLLRGGDAPFSYTGERLWVKDVMPVPGSLQSPRLPIIVGGQSPTVVRVAAMYADGIPMADRARRLRKCSTTPPSSHAGSTSWPWPRGAIPRRSGAPTPSSVPGIRGRETSRTRMCSTVSVPLALATSSSIGRTTPTSRNSKGLPER
jgi:alkanesulfonate monooxygenase SsuD/methylene tetrahydromethanopterin reductase-like flavin-dependent oxidoreductase (luciferase family)